MLVDEVKSGIVKYLLWVDLCELLTSITSEPPVISLFVHPAHLYCTVIPHLVRDIEAIDNTQFPHSLVGMGTIIDDTVHIISLEA